MALRPIQESYALFEIGTSTARRTSSRSVEKPMGSGDAAIGSLVLDSLSSCWETCGSRKVDNDFTSRASDRSQMDDFVPECGGIV